MAIYIDNTAISGGGDSADLKEYVENLYKKLSSEGKVLKIVNGTPTWSTIE